MPNHLLPFRRSAALLLLVALSFGCAGKKHALEGDSSAMHHALSMALGDAALGLQPQSYRSAWTDLDGDELADAVVLLRGPDFESPEGLTLVVLRARGGDFESIGRVTGVVPPVLATYRISEGHRNLILGARNPDGSPGRRLLEFDGSTYSPTPGAGASIDPSPSDQVLIAEDPEQ